MTNEAMLRNLPDTSKSIFTRLRMDGPLTKADLLRLPDMTLTTLNRFMKPLETRALIAECGLADSSGGRKPALYDVDRRRYRLIGMDISRTYTQVVVTNLKMEVMRKFQFPMDSSCTPERTVARAAGLLREAFDTNRIAQDDIIGIGIAAVGPLDAERGVILNPLNFAAPGWTNVPITEMASKSLGLSAVMDNGANCAVTAEHHFGSGRGLENIAYFNCGVGIRCGSISGGQLVRAPDGAEDAFAHMTVDVDGERCSCGKRGCVECYAGIRAIENFYSAQHGKNARAFSFQEICEASEAGEAAAVRTIERAATIFGTGLANYMNLLNPDLIVLSGPLIERSALFNRIAIETAIGRNYLGSGTHTAFRKGGLFGDAVMAIGAAAMAIEFSLYAKNDT